MIQFEEFVSDLGKDLAAVGLRQFIVWESSQFLDCGSDFFVELVLNDGSKIPEAEGLLARAAKDLQRDGVRLDCVVRADWEINDIRPIGHAISSNGCPKASKAFMAELKSGNTTCRISVDLTFSAIESLRRKHADTSRSTEKSLPTNELAAVRRYLEFMLSHGGTSYWDPLTFRRLELNEPAMFGLCFWGLN
jgi:hypothetical protein